jgi:hypothetical protein
VSQGQATNGLAMANADASLRRDPSPLLNA